MRQLKANFDGSQHLRGTAMTTHISRTAIMIHESIQDTDKSNATPFYFHTNTDTKRDKF